MQKLPLLISGILLTAPNVFFKHCNFTYMNKRPLVPSFLQRLDDTLLRNKPNTWAARTHLVIWFAVLFALPLTAFCYLAFFDAKQYSSTGSWTTFVGLIAFIGFVFWLIFLLRFNVFKRYGNWFMWDGLKSFGLYFLSIGAMVALCFIPSAVETYRANQQFGNDEIVNDINEINTNACKLEYNLLPLHWTADTFDIIKRPVTTTTYTEEEMVTVDTVVTAVLDQASIEPVQNYVRQHSVMDTAELRRKIAETDSLVKINDSLYVFYKCPDYQFVSSYNADGHATKKILRSADIYYAVVKNYQKPNNRPALLTRMDELKAKYAADSRYSSYIDFDVAYDANDDYEKKIKNKYNLTQIGYGIDNAVTKKYAWIDNWHVYLRFFYYITLLATLLVFIFRHSTVKTFFLSVLTAVLLMIITGLLMVMSNGNETSVLSFMIVYYLIFAIIALSIFAAKVRNAIQGISLNLFLFATPFIPLIFVALNEVIKQRQSYIIKTQEVDNSALYFLIAEIAGSVILLVLLEPLFRKLYRKWYAAPEN